MKNKLYEILIVLSYSGRTQFAIFMGIFFFVLIMVIGHYQLADFHLRLAPQISDVIREEFQKKYDKAAIGSLIGFWIFAYRLYKEDRRKVFH